MKLRCTKCGDIESIPDRKYNNMQKKGEDKEFKCRWCSNQQRKQDEADEILKKYDTGRKMRTNEEQLKLEYKALKKMEKNKKVPIEIIERRKRIIAYKEKFGF